MASGKCATPTLRWRRGNTGTRGYGTVSSECGEPATFHAPFERLRARTGNRKIPGTRKPARQRIFACRPSVLPRPFDGFMTQRSRRATLR